MTYAILRGFATTPSDSSPMRLKSLKMAGFKSFVDATTLHFPSNLVGIVGPNGCGKSNIVDAIRWVMGESSAKQLRGESMADVIFNGSTGRKPVGQAMVELIFDNSDASLGGEYAKYSEIAIKRQVTRDGQSDYYLNGSKCRRKDIIDIFLGTGLGPNSYSVIEQGMISRFIEAKPDELRVYLEEAAGVSKYKERRRETETRIRHTRENLERLEDVRQEVLKQLEVLRRQASSASKYKILKEEERHTKAKCLALQWKNLKANSSAQEKIMGDLTVEIEARVADQHHTGALLEKAREEHSLANDAFNNTQGHFYAVGSEIAALEQNLKHQRERLSTLQNDHKQAEANWTGLQTHVTLDEERLSQLSTELETTLPEITVAEQEAEEKDRLLRQADEALTVSQTEWEQFNQGAAEILQKARVEQTRIQHLEQQIVSIEKRLERIAAEQAQINFAYLDEEINKLSTQQETSQQKIQSAQKDLTAALTTLTNKQQNRESLTHTLDEVRNRLQSLRGRQASLLALQQAAIGSGKGSAQEWLHERVLSQQTRLALKLDVTPEWELAVETVLGPYLEAICVKDSSYFADDFTDLAEGEIILFDEETPSNNVMPENSPPEEGWHAKRDGVVEIALIPSPETGEGARRADEGKISTTPPFGHPSSGGEFKTSPSLLSNQIKSDYPIQTLLKNIYCADTLDEALEIRKDLSEGASVITREGLWLGRNWVRVSKTQDLNGSIIKREKELQSLQTQLDTDLSHKTELEAQLEIEKLALQEAETHRSQLQKQLDMARDEANKLTTQIAVQRSTRDRLSHRSQQLETESQEQHPLLKQHHEDLAALRESWQAAVAAIEADEARRESLTAKRNAARTELETHREATRLAKERSHRLTVRIESLRLQKKSGEENLARMQQQLNTLSERRAQLIAALATADEPLESLEADLKSKLQLRSETETALQTARARVEQVTESVHQFEKQRDQFAALAEKLKGQLQQHQIDLQSDKVRCTVCEEQIVALDYTLEAVLAALSEIDAIAAMEETLQTLVNRIARLGAINLLAIEEVVVQEERSLYLAAQFTDLNDALTTLESAIRKIDAETKTLFEDTFNLVNTRFQELFPRIFGGGSASLELTGDDLLSTGILVMAHPPGKRNSSIHLLSGGEKALTAVALVFSIFQLNPAPFCLLDEVDAPLDDANVVRFCNLVREMSTQVQFMFISHNKVAIEMADHLTGVTMHEPGVSRIVAVDVQEAVALATA